MADNLQGKMVSVGLLVLMGLGTWNVAQVHLMAMRLQRVEDQMIQQTKNRWSSAHQAIWASELGKRNTNLTVPDPVETLRHFDP